MSVGEDIQGPVVTLTGLRNPCPQIETFRTGLQERVVVRGTQRSIVGRKAGIMGVVVEKSGVIKPGMRVAVELPGKFEALACV